MPFSGVFLEWHCCAVFFFSSPKRMMFPRRLTIKKALFLWNTRPCFSPMWLLRMTSNCFWFLDRPPVSKGLMCSPSLHLLLIFFFSLVVRWLAPLLEIFFFTESVCGFLAIRSIRVDCWILKLFLPDRSSKYRQTDTWKSVKKLSDIWKSLHVQSRVLVNWDLWEEGFGFLRGATWFRWSRARRFDQRRMIAYFGDP